MTPYSSLRAAVLDLERNGMLLRIKEEIDPNLDMAAIHEGRKGRRRRKEGRMESVCVMTKSPIPG